MFTQASNDDGPNNNDLMDSSNIYDSDGMANPDPNPNPHSNLDTSNLEEQNKQLLAAVKQLQQQQVSVCNLVGMSVEKPIDLSGANNSSTGTESDAAESIEAEVVGYDKDQTLEKAMAIERELNKQKSVQARVNKAAGLPKLLRPNHLCDRADHVDE